MSMFKLQTALRKSSNI